MKKSIDELIKSKINFKLKPLIETIIIGNSHTECAINDNLITGIKNLSRSGESYFYSYVKLKQILRKNHSIKNVIIGFSNSEITMKSDSDIWSNESVSRYCIYFPFMDSDEKKLIQNNNLLYYLKANSLYLRKFLENEYKNQWGNLYEAGGFYMLKRILNDSLINEYIKKYDSSTFKQVYSNYNLIYLDKIITLCKSKKINIVFIRTPFHVNYVGFVNEYKFQKLLREKYNNIIFWDFCNFKLEKSDFADLEHLNISGAEKFTKYLYQEFISKKD
jgi:hypothetical protein